MLSLKEKSKKGNLKSTTNSQKRGKKSNARLHVVDSLVSLQHTEAVLRLWMPTYDELQTISDGEVMQVAAVHDCFLSVGRSKIISFGCNL